MPNPTAGDVHVNGPLTNISVAYIQSQSMFIADRVFPNVPVAKQSDRYFVYDKGDWNRTEARLRAPGTESAGSGWRVDNTPTYFCDVLAVHKDIDDQTRANEDSPLSMDRDATTWTTQQLLIKKDKLWSAAYFTTGKWGTDLTGVSGTPGAGEFKQWDVSGSTPIEDVTTQVVTIAESTGLRPNTLVLSPWVYLALSNHAEILARIQYTQRGVVTTDILASLFGVPNVMVAWAIENTANEEATESMSFIHGKHALLVYANPTPSLMQPSGGYTFSWSGFMGAGALGTRIKRFRMEHLESDRVEGQMAYAHKLVSSDCGVLFAGAVS